MNIKKFGYTILIVLLVVSFVFMGKTYFNAHQLIKNKIVASRTSITVDTVDKESFVATTSITTISGRAEGVQTVVLEVRDPKHAGLGDVIYSMSAQVVNGRWAFPAIGSPTPGNYYNVLVYAPETESNQNYCEKRFTLTRKPLTTKPPSSTITLAEFPTEITLTDGMAAKSADGKYTIWVDEAAKFMPIIKVITPNGYFESQNLKADTFKIQTLGNLNVFLCSDGYTISGHTTVLGISLAGGKQIRECQNGMF